MRHEIYRYRWALVRVAGTWFLLGLVAAKSWEALWATLPLYGFMGLSFLAPGYRHEESWGHRHARRLQRKLQHLPFSLIWWGFGPFLWPAMIFKD